MRLRIIKLPTSCIWGFTRSDLRVGEIREFGPQFAAVFLSEGWGEPVSSTSTVGPTVLVVDDDLELQRFAAVVLMSYGYDVVAAANGREALRCLKDCPPDVILLDLNMPVMDGWEFRAEQQRLGDRRLAAIPVLLLTGAEARRAEDDAARLRAAGVLAKPIDPSVLVRAIRTTVPDAHAGGW